MIKVHQTKSRLTLGTAIAAMLAASVAATAPMPAAAQSQAGTYRPSRQVLLSVGEGQLVNLPRSVVDVWTSNSEVADVNVTSSRQIGVFGKATGEATIIATASDGAVVWGAHVRVSQNISSVDEMMRAAMPDSNITVTHVGQIAVMNGTVRSPADSAQAEQLLRTVLNPGIDVNAPGAALKVLPVNRLRLATPLQVMLQVKIAEVSRQTARDVGVNLLSRDTTGGFLFGLFRGRSPGTITDIPSGSIIDPLTGNPAIVGTRVNVNNPGVGTTISGFGNILGVDVLGALDLAETNGLVTTLAEPNLTALSGETASFLAGGEFPVVTTSDNGTTVEYKSYGVSLAFTPTVLEGGRISMRVRPEVSQLTSQGSVRLNGIEIPALTTRRAETTVELGSGQSFMIGGLLQNGGNNSVDRTPFLGSLPILGALFRSKSFRRNETELVIVITPYLVRPVNAGAISLPTDGYRSTSPGAQVILDQDENGRNGAVRPGPSVAVESAAPGVASVSNPPLPAPAPARRAARPAPARPEQQASAAPGFSF